MTVDITNIVIFNALATLFIMFWMYRSSILTRSNTEKIFEQFNQEHRNLSEYVNQRMDKMDTENHRRNEDTMRYLSEETNDLYRRVEDLRDYTDRLNEKSTDGINSRIPL
jgi:hypothetical protein